MFAIYVRNKTTEVKIHKDTCKYYLGRNPDGTSRGMWFEGKLTLRETYAKAKQMTGPGWTITTCQHCCKYLPLPILATEGMTEPERARLAGSIGRKPTARRRIGQCTTVEDVMKYCRDQGWNLHTMLKHLGSALDKVEESGSMEQGLFQDSLLRQVAQLVAYYNVPPEAFHNWQA